MDPFVLNHLSNGLTIGKAVYYVAWKASIDKAVIVIYDPLEIFVGSELVDENGEPIAFPSELRAHAFLLELKEENDDVDLHTD